MKDWRILIVCAVGLLLAATGAQAQFTNGDFENGSDGWTWVNMPTWQLDFPAAGGNPGGYAEFMSSFGDSEGEGSLTQTFDCGEASEDICIITFDYKLEMVDAGPETGHVRAVLDGQEVFDSPVGNFIDWNTVTLSANCGQHTITVYLQVDAGNNGWRASFDNFTASCESVALDEQTWSGLKALYR